MRANAQEMFLPENLVLRRRTVRLDGLVIKQETLYFAHIMDEMGNVARLLSWTPLTVTESGKDVTVVYDPVTGDYSFSVTVKT